MKFVAENEKEFIDKTFEAIKSSIGPGFVLGLVGDLGVGKTTLVKSIAKKLGSTETVSSPTFVYMREYPIKSKNGINMIRHIDLYRLGEATETQSKEIMEWLKAADALVIVEWADLLKNEKLFDAIVSIDYLDNTGRKVSIIWK